MNIISTHKKASYLRKNQDWLEGTPNNREVLLCDHSVVCSCAYRYIHNIGALGLHPKLQLLYDSSTLYFSIYFLPMYLSYFYKDTTTGRCQTNVNVLTL